MAEVEYHAALRILGNPLQLEEITHTLNVQPSRVHVPGDVDILGHSFSDFMWLLESPLGRREDLTAHLTWLRTTLSPSYSYLRSLRNIADISILCSYRTYETDQGGFTLQPDDFSMASELGVRMEFHLLSL